MAANSRNKLLLNISVKREMKIRLVVAYSKSLYIFYVRQIAYVCKMNNDATLLLASPIPTPKAK